jgi:hypothetical protein
MTEPRRPWAQLQIQFPKEVQNLINMALHGRRWIQHLYLEGQVVKWEGSQGNGTDNDCYGLQENYQQTQSQRILT